MGILATAVGKTVNLHLAHKVLYRQNGWQHKYSWQRNGGNKEISSCISDDAEMLSRLHSGVIQCCKMCHHCPPTPCIFLEKMSKHHPTPPYPTPTHLIYWNNSQSHHVMTNKVPLFSCSRSIEPLSICYNFSVLFLFPVQLSNECWPQQSPGSSS